MRDKVTEEQLWRVQVGWLKAAGGVAQEPTAHEETIANSSRNPDREYIRYYAAIRRGQLSALASPVQPRRQSCWKSERETYHLVD